MSWPVRLAKLKSTQMTDGMMSNDKERSQLGFAHTSFSYLQVCLYIIFVIPVSFRGGSFKGKKNL